MTEEKGENTHFRRHWLDCGNVQSSWIRLRAPEIQLRWLNYGLFFSHIQLLRGSGEGAERGGGVMGWIRAEVLRGKYGGRVNITQECHFGDEPRDAGWVRWELWAQEGCREGIRVGLVEQKSQRGRRLLGMAKQQAEDPRCPRGPVEQSHYACPGPPSPEK